MSPIHIRPQRVFDAKRFFEILNNPNFKYFNARPKSIAYEKEWLKKNPKKRKNNEEYNYTITYNNKVIGGMGVTLHAKRKFIGEIGYFLDEKYWGQGFATQAVKQLEKICFTKLKLTRIEIVMVDKHKASEKVAIKCGYKKEGKMKKSILNKGEYYDAYLYAKTK